MIANHSQRILTIIQSNIFWGFLSFKIKYNEKSEQRYVENGWLPWLWCRLTLCISIRNRQTGLIWTKMSATTGLRLYWNTILLKYHGKLDIFCSIFSKNYPYFYSNVLLIYIYIRCKNCSANYTLLLIHQKIIQTLWIFYFVFGNFLS